MTIPALYDLFLQYPVITTDTRNCPEGSIFVALKGANFNGNEFAQQALEHGSEYAIIDEKEYATDKRIILVDNSLLTLQKLANYHRKQLGTRIIGITGTNGKTTTKELLAAVLSRKYKILYTQGNLNNQIGVPLTLLKLTKEHELAVIEMGASHPGDIRELVEIAEPDYGLITNIGKAHLEGFGSFENIISTKGELFNYLRSKPDAVVFVHYEDKYLQGIAEGLKPVYYGEEDSLFVNGKIISCSPFLTFEWKEAGDSGNPHQVETHLIGGYNLDNLLSAVTIGKYFGVKPDDIDNALKEYIPQNNRSQFKDTGKNKLIIDAYNANPTSMKAALRNFHDMEGNPKMLILGDMKELAETSMEEHQSIVDYITKGDFDRVMLIGDQFGAANHTFPCFNNVKEAIENLRIDKPEGYYILIKGSNSTRLTEVIDCL